LHGSSATVWRVGVAAAGVGADAATGVVLADATPVVVAAAIPSAIAAVAMFAATLFTFILIAFPSDQTRLTGLP
jgi:hypothetical protein